MIDETTMNILSSAQAKAFIFELDAHYLINYKCPVPYFTQLPKYPAVRRDVSVMVPLSCTVSDIALCMKNTSAKIKSVTLIDFFSKPEWTDQKSLTFHIELYDEQKTLEADEIDDIWNVLIAALRHKGATIR